MQQVLLLFVVAVSLLFVWALTTSRVTDTERDEMMDDEELWP